MEKSREILRKYWGFDSFRPLQEEIVDNVIYGHDTLAILPTGGGKSICFQVPGMALDGVTLVVSPLIALMQDQVENLLAKGINAACITSSMSYREVDITLDNARFGNLKFLYTSPERLKSELFIERFKSMKISLFVIDEAHCISEWGHDFRPAYREISEAKAIHPNAPMIALTASATDRVKEDIVSQLGLKSPKIVSGSLERKNISYRVQTSENKLKSIIEFCQLRPNETGIIYCQTRKSVKDVVTQLRAHRIPAGFYHGGLSASDRSFMLENWLKNQLKVMVATNAFGMGIDKPDVRYVLHYEIPNNLEAYYQEAGRAGRDQQASTAIAYWEMKDLEKMRGQLEQKFPSLETIKRVYNATCNFLSVAFESGLGETYDFDIKAFTKSFDLSVSETYYALKLLELDGKIQFSENVFQRTRMKFVVGNSALYKFQVGHESVSEFITLLTRSYPGIFDRFIYLHEDKLAKRLKIKESELIEKLKYMEQYGIADVTYRSNSPKVTFLEDRIPDNRLTISRSVFYDRKEVAFSKLDAIEKYLQSGECRSQVISAYFNAPTEPCGNCDICLENKHSTHTQQELLEIIPTLLPATLDQIIHQLSIQRELAKRTIRSLILEEKITFDGNNYQNI